MKLKKGVNFGGYLSQCVHTKEHYDTFILEKDVETVAKLGFDHIRLPFDSELVLSSDGKFIESGFDYLTQMIEWCKKYNLNIVLDLHKAPGYDFNDAGNKEKNNLFNNAYCQKLFIELWNSISFRYGFYQNVAFELLNEVVESEVAENWNILIKNTVEKIRSNAPTTPIIYGGIQWNSARTLKLLDKPIDENIISAFEKKLSHMYSQEQADFLLGFPLAKPNASCPKNQVKRNNNITVIVDTDECDCRGCSHKCTCKNCIYRYICYFRGARTSEICHIKNMLSKLLEEN